MKRHERTEVTWHGLVGEVAGDDLPKPSSLSMNGELKQIAWIVAGHVRSQPLLLVRMRCGIYGFLALTKKMLFLRMVKTSDLSYLARKVRQIASTHSLRRKELQGLYFEPAFDAASKITPATFDG